MNTPSDNQSKDFILPQNMHEILAAKVQQTSSS